jgi:tetratricopeptide (TPR) repeat protein
MSSGAHAGLLLLFGLLGTTAQAEPTAADRKRAGELATESAKHYKRREFEVSVALLRKAYALYPEPNLLYNLARSLEGMGDKRGAVDEYNKYLATAKRVDDRGAIERRVTMLERELAEKQSPAPTKPREPKTEAAAPAIEPPGPPLDVPLADPFAPPPEKVTGPSKLPLIPIGVGVAAIGAGITFGLRARELERSAIKDPVAFDASKDYADAVTNARVANILFVAGGAVLAAGVVWEVFELRAQRKNSDAVTMTVHPTLSARGIVLEWTLP